MLLSSSLESPAILAVHSGLQLAQVPMNSVPSIRWLRPVPSPARLALLIFLLALASPRLHAQQQDYTPCLGCAEHNEIRTRWVKPWAAELAVEGTLAADNFRLESEAQHLGLCETNPLMRVSLAINGCHAFSERRAIFEAAPLEVLAFVSPAWGLGRMGHPRWAMALESVPIFGHALAIRRTTEAIHRWQRLQALLQ